MDGWMTNNLARRYSRKNVAELNGIARLTQRTHTSLGGLNANHKPHATNHKPQITTHTPQATTHFLILPHGHRPNDSRDTGSNPDGGL